MVAAFLRLTATESERARALRALTLHMLAGHAPTFFRRALLEPLLHRAVAALAGVPADLGPELHPDDGMARIDAWYVRRESGLPHPAPDQAALRSYLQAIYRDGYWVHAWLLGEMAHALGVEARLEIPERPLRGRSRLHDLYWLTHLFLLETRYLWQPLPPTGWEARIWELKASTAWMVEQRQVDLGAEAAICLQLAAEHETPEHQSLLALIARHQRADGSVVDPSREETEERIAHATAAGLLALAGATERMAPGDVRLIEACAN